MTFIFLKIGSIRLNLNEGWKGGVYRIEPPTAVGAGWGHDTPNGS